MWDAVRSAAPQYVRNRVGHAVAASKRGVSKKGDRMATTGGGIATTGGDRGRIGADGGRCGAAREVLLSLSLHGCAPFSGQETGRRFYWPGALIMAARAFFGPRAFMAARCVLVARLFRERTWGKGVSEQVQVPLQHQVSLFRLSQAFQPYLHQVSLTCHATPPSAAAADIAAVATVNAAAGDSEQRAPPPSSQRRRRWCAARRRGGRPATRRRAPSP